MASTYEKIRQSLVSKLIFSVGLTLFFSIFIWAYFNIQYQKEKVMETLLTAADRLSTTTKLGTHYAMMINSREDINEIINNISKQEEIRNIRIYNKAGDIKFSNDPTEVDKTTNIKDEACYICHRTDPPQSHLELNERMRLFYSPTGEHLLGIISPIYNEPGCSSNSCHVHPKDKQILGALDFVVSLTATDREILKLEKGVIGLAFFIFIVSSLLIFIFVYRFVNLPISKLIAGTKRIARGDYSKKIEVTKEIEMGLLADAINQMSDKIALKEEELSRQKNEYQNLFEQVPCIVTVQDRNYKLLRYNREFSERFDPEAGDFCYHAYKGRTEKCVICPVENTFEDGESHFSEEAGLNKDGSITHWVVKTAPIKNASGEVIAAMEMCLDITSHKILEDELEKSEKKYYAIFNNIPNPVFVLDMDNFTILDCNESVKAVYGYDKEEMIDRSFLDLFFEEERNHYAFKLKSFGLIDKARQNHKTGKTIFANIRISPSEYPGTRVMLVTTSDITKRLEAEQQLTQASKMATLGEMATGIAHELNQPLTVIKTASSFLNKKMERQEDIKDDVLLNLSRKINNNVDRASKIINHMREFARKSDMMLEDVQMNTVIERAVDIFSQQLKLRGIETVLELDENLPLILADAGRLEQVFINLLINARDAIEENGMDISGAEAEKKITIKTKSEGQYVIAEVADTGRGIPPAIADKLFEPFFTTKEVGKGTGLGLSISYGIVKDFRGEIRHVHRSKGACFRIIFPMSHSKDTEELFEKNG